MGLLHGVERDPVTINTFSCDLGSKDGWSLSQVVSGLNGESRVEKKKKAQRINNADKAPARKMEGRSKVRIVGFRQLACEKTTMDSDECFAFPM
ncbi:hypothetical protein L1987_72746 [Smallanthus sonchifolius]|uniref:Uncharacterized protein n=1 Tax=Smallanthus sonchifolius TaxID=185202 RepID=A0ACB9AVN8_9ASTR|nr:hypothetical protein L1987_72746 [Smallanthus sonchifolius]